MCTECVLYSVQCILLCAVESVSPFALLRILCAALSWLTASVVVERATTCEECVAMMMLQIFPTTPAGVAKGGQNLTVERGLRFVLYRVHQKKCIIAILA